MLEKEIDIIGLEEVRRKEEKIINTKKDSIIFHTESDGVGFIVSSHLKNSIKKFTGINDRITMMEMELGKGNMVIIQVHGPTLNSKQGVIENFYEEINEVIRNTLNNKLRKYRNKNTMILIMEDFNSQIGKREEEEERVIGPYHYGSRNKNGDSMIEFAQENDLKI